MVFFIKLECRPGWGIQSESQNGFECETQSWIESETESGTQCEIV